MLLLRLKYGFLIRALILRHVDHVDPVMHKRLALPLSLCVAALPTSIVCAHSDTIYSFTPSLPIIIITSLDRAKALCGGKESHSLAYRD